DGERCRRGPGGEGENVTVARVRDRWGRKRRIGAVPDGGIVAVEIAEILTRCVRRARIDQPTIGGADSITAPVVDECAGGGKSDGPTGDRAGRSDRETTVCQDRQIASGATAHGGIYRNVSAGVEHQRTIAPVHRIRDGNVGRAAHGRKRRIAGGGPTSDAACGADGYGPAAGEVHRAGIGRDGANQVARVVEGVASAA